jgi:hypothetical protein
LIHVRDKRFFCAPKHPFNPFNGYRKALYQGLKSQGREADHSFPFSVEVKDDRSNASLLHTPIGL